MDWASADSLSAVASRVRASAWRLAWVAWTKPTTAPIAPTMACLDDGQYARSSAQVGGVGFGDALAFPGLAGLFFGVTVFGLALFFFFGQALVFGGPAGPTLRDGAIRFKPQLPTGHGTRLTCGAWASIPKIGIPMRRAITRWASGPLASSCAEAQGPAQQISCVDDVRRGARIDLHASGQVP
jgi:hypothetical protein